MLVTDRNGLPLSQGKFMIDMERQEFFWSRVSRRGDHLIWTGAHTDRGYGKITINNVNVYANRVAYCIANNLSLTQIEDSNILIVCDEPGCVEAKHLVRKKKRSKKV
jgi:hypothetical protein